MSAAVPVSRVNFNTWKKNIMLRTTNLAKTTAFLIFLSAIFSCSAAELNSRDLVPELENRRLFFRTDSPALFYEYEECVKHFLGICTKKEWHTDTYDLTDPAVRQRLVNMGFTATSDRRKQ